MAHSGATISEGIRDYYRSRLLWPLFLLLALIVIGIFSPVRSLIFPTEISQGMPLEEVAEYGVDYVKVDIEKLYFTGYTCERYGNIVGYYYYTAWGNSYVFVLLSPNQCEQGLPMLENIRVKGALRHETSELDSLFKYLSSDLNWSYDGISGNMSHYLISQPVAENFSSYYIGVVYVLAWAFTIVSLAGYLTFVALPYMAPPIQLLRPLGNPAEILQNAEKDLADFPQLVADEVCITREFFVVISHNGISLVPISRIVWMYKHAPVRRIFGKNLEIEYSLYLLTEKNHLIHCPGIHQKDMDGIIDYMTEANPDILVGYTEENRQAARARI